MFSRPGLVVGVVAAVAASVVVGVAPAGAAAPALQVSASASPSPASSLSASGFVALSPARVLDTQSGGVTVDGQGAGGGVVDSVPRSVVVAGRGGVPASGVEAVVLNVTAVSPTAEGYVSVYPAGESLPVASTVQVTAGSTTSNVATTKVGAGGAVSSVVSAGSAHLQVEVVGYWPADGSFVALSAGRLIDTRSGGTTVDGRSQGGGAVAAATTRVLPVLGRHGIPATGVAAVVLNVSASAPSAATRVTVYPRFAPRPNAWNLNVAAGEARSTMVVVAPGAGGSLALHNHGAGAADLWADVAGYIPAGTSFTSVAPGRLLDTRPAGFTVDGEGLGGGAVSTNRTVEVQVAGRHGIPSSGVSAVVMTVTGLYPTRATGVTAYPAGQPRPASANLHLVAGVNRTNLVVVPVGASGAVTLHNAAGSTNLLASVVGYVSSDASLTGLVTDAAGGGPLAGVDVTVSWNGSSEARYLETDADGVYRLDGLPAGSDYSVCFWAPSSAPEGATTTGNLSQCHGSPSPGEPGTPVTLTAGMTTTVDAVLAPGGAIAGVVTDAEAGGPVAGVAVKVLSTPGEFDLTTDADGRYRLVGLTPGSDYTVCFTPQAWKYLAECHEEVSPYGTPTPVTVTAGATTTVDASLTPVVVPPQTVTGLVTDDGPGAAPLVGVEVIAKTGLDPGNQGRAVTGPDGRYRMEGLPAGVPFKVCFRPGSADVGGSSTTGYIDECHDDWDEVLKGWPEDTMVTLAAGETATIDAGLRHGASVSGVVTDGVGGPPLAGVGVRVKSDRDGKSVTTGADGRYRADGLRPEKTYTVCFDAAEATGGASQTGYLDECHDDVAPDGSATPVSVTVDAVTTVDAALGGAPSIEGLVTDAEGGAPLQGVSVRLASGAGDWSVQTGEDGRYRFTGLVPGSDYTVCLSPDEVTGGASPTGYLRECYDDRLDGQGATRVTLTAGSATTIDVDLARAAVVTGVVTDSGGAPVAGVDVTVAGDLDMGWASTDAQGRFTSSKVVAGSSYRVCFAANTATGGASTTGYLDECHDGIAPGGTPSPVTLLAGVATTIDAELLAGAAVTGVVTNDAGQTLEFARVTVKGATGTKEVWSDGSGRYQVGGLPSGSGYVVCIDGDQAESMVGDNSAYVSECFDDVAQGGTPTPVTLTAPNAVTIDVVLAR